MEMRLDVKRLAKSRGRYFLPFQGED